MEKNKIHPLIAAIMCASCANKDNCDNDCAPSRKEQFKHMLSETEGLVEYLNSEDSKKHLAALGDCGIVILNISKISKEDILSVDKKDIVKYINNIKTVRREFNEYIDNAINIISNHNKSREKENVSDDLDNLSREELIKIIRNKQ